MRHKILPSIAILLLVFLGCENKGNSIVTLEKDGLKTGVKFDSLYFGYRFGMDPRQFADHTGSIPQTVKIDKSNPIEPIITMYFFGKPFEGRLKPTFYRSHGLSRLHVTLKDVYGGSDKEIERYFDEKNQKAKKTKLGDSTYWIEGNRTISLSKLEGSNIFLLSYRSNSIAELETIDLMKER